MIRKLTSLEIHEKVSRRYAEISCSIKDRFKYPTGKTGAEMLGYDFSAFGGRVSDNIVESFCGVGNPFTLRPVRKGEIILDVGCGAGVDVIIAGLSTGVGGEVYGIDLVPEMVNKARKNIESSELSNCEIRTAGSESIPFDENTFDAVIANGSLYLSPLKEKTFSEIYRVLRPDGHFQFADVVLKDGLPDRVVNLFNGWSG